MKWLYEEMKKSKDIESAKILVLSILKQNNWNISKIAKIVWTCRKTIIRCRDWTLENISNRPKTINFNF